MRYQLAQNKVFNIFFFQIYLKIAGIDVNPHARVQVNFEFEPVKEIEVMSKLPKMTFPFLWFEESANIPDYMLNLLKYTVTLYVDVAYS